MDNLYFEEEIKDKEYFEDKIEKLEERIKSLEELMKDIAFQKRISERWHRELNEN